MPANNDAVLVTVIMPVFNATRTLSTALRSVLHQTHRDLELLAVDDGSTDDTSRLLQTWARRDQRLRVLWYGDNRGRSAARNYAIDEASGEWLTFIDADDLWARTRLERLLAVAASNPSVDLVTDDRIGFKVSSKGKVALQHRFPSREAWGFGGVEPLALRGWAMDKRHLDPLVRRSFVIDSGARYPENLSSSEDQSFCMQLVFAKNGCSAVRLAEPLYYYRLGWATRPKDRDLNFVRSIRIAIDQTGSAELERLVAPAVRGEIALLRRDSAMRTRVGRLAEADHLAHDDPEVREVARPTGRLLVWRALWFRRSLIALSMLADSRARRGMLEDIRRLLRDPDVD